MPNVAEECSRALDLDSEVPVDFDGSGVEGSGVVEDINQCKSGRNKCSPDAWCYNMPDTKEKVALNINFCAEKS